MFVQFYSQIKSFFSGQEHWIGLKNIYYLTQSRGYTLRVTLKDFTGGVGVANYATFKILDNVSLQLLTI